VGWTFCWLLVVLKIPILAAIALVWWAIRAEPEPVAGQHDDEGEGGSKVPESHRVRPRRPRRPRGPHGSPMLPSPPRVRHRTVARARTPHR
jgi:hypothetical protein